MNLDRNQRTIFIFAITFYLITRLYQLTDFPAHFFCDEVIGAIWALELISGKGFVNGVFLPTQFESFGYYGLGTSIYLQVLPQLLFYPSFYATKAAAVIASLVLPISLSLWAKKVLQTKHWIRVILIVSFIPYWFLHSRTAFEFVLATAFLAGAATCYSIYLKGNSNALVWAPSF